MKLSDGILYGGLTVLWGWNGYPNNIVKQNDKVLEQMFSPQLRN